MTALINSVHGRNGVEGPNLSKDRRLSRPRSRWRGAIAIAALIFAIAMLPSLSEALIWPVQSRFHRANLTDGPGIAGFIALGGSIDRIEEAIALAHNHPGTRVVVTGHEALPTEFFKERGIGGDRLLVEPAASNTYENASHTAQLLGPKRFRRWVLVTSASHMPRAMGCFRKAGFAVEAWPVPDRTKDWGNRLQRAAHEWVGLLVYWLDGRTDALFPSPHARTAMATAAVTAGPDRAGGSATP